MTGRMRTTSNAIDVSPRAVGSGVKGMREATNHFRGVASIVLVAALVLVSAWAAPAATLCDSGLGVEAIHAQWLPATTTTEHAVRSLAELVHEQPHRLAATDHGCSRSSSPTQAPALAPKSGTSSWTFKQAKGAAYDEWVNEAFYGGSPAKKPFFRIDGQGRYLDNLVDEAGARVGVENKLFRLKRGTLDVNTGVRRGTALRRNLAEALRRARGQARSHQRLLEEGVVDRFDWNLSGNYPRFESWLRNLGLNVNVRPMP